ncbi:MAG: ABC transporter ATP-binding protein [Roseovarius sp.]
MLDTPIARIENLAVRFATRASDVVAVEDVSIAINPGETLCVVGESGSGKSVTSLALMRLLDDQNAQITHGRILFDRGGDGTLDITAAGSDLMRDIRGNQIGMIFQEPMTALNPVFTVGYQLGEGLRLHRGMTKKAARVRALELLHDVRMPQPERRLDQYPHELSGGMRQRVVIAMALACKPRLLIADEPTTALDVTTQADILALINRLKRDTGAAVLFITHDMAVVAQMADRVVVMQRGRIVEDGPVEQIFNAPCHAYTKALLAAVPKLGDMRGVPHPVPMALVGEGPAAIPTPPQPQTSQDTALLTVTGLTTRFDVKGGLFRRTVARVHAVEDVSFILARGRTLALVGESGCGKSTVARSVMRLVDPTAGRVELDGVDLLALGPAQLRRARKDMQMVFQDPFGSLNPQMRLMDQVAEPLINHLSLSRHQRQARVAQLFDRVELPQSFLRRYPHELSGGQRQRVAIARALAVSPKLIVADEAVSALDVSVQAQVLNLMMQLQADLGVSYLFISHDMAVVERISHDVAVMYLGRIVEYGPRAAVFENPQHAYTQALLRAVPVADPAQRRADATPCAEPASSPIHPLGYDPAPSVYREVSPHHFVLTSECAP